MDYLDAPDYLRGADLHNIGGNKESFFDSPIEQTADFVSKIPSFAVASVVSGANSIYNSGVTVGNFLGVTDAEEADTHSVLMSMDSDLGKYYEEHKQAVDLTGFVVGSLVPGIAGIKALNYGQKALSGALKTGTVGKNLAEATGLIETVTADGLSLSQVAGKSLAESGQVFSFANANVLKAVASGVGQSALEGMAFEAMVNATMFKSPVLEGHDIKDIGSNILTAGLLGGVIGGALGAAKTYGVVKGAIKEVDSAQYGFKARASQAAVEEPADRIIVALGDKAVTPTATTPIEEALVAKRYQNITNEVRGEAHKLVAGDTEVGNLLGDTILSIDKPDVVANFLSGARVVSRAGANLAPAEGHTAAYLTIHGVDDVGSTVFEGFNTRNLTLADKLPNKAAVDKFVADAKFTAKKEWDALTTGSLDEVEARFIWAEKSAKYEEGMRINSTDIPMLEGAVRNKLEKLVINDSEFVYTVSGADNVANELLQAKRDLINKLRVSKSKAWAFGEDSKSATWGESEQHVLSTDEIARMANVSRKVIEAGEDTGASMFARQDAQAAFLKSRADVGVTPTIADLDYIPRHLSVVYDSSKFVGVDGNMLSALTNIKQQQKVFQQAADTAVAGIMGEELAARAVHATDKMMAGANRLGSGAGLISHSNGGYGTLASWSESIGKLTFDLTNKLKVETAAKLDSVALKLRSNQVAAIEWDKVQNLVSAQVEKYTLNQAGDALIPTKVRDYLAAVERGEDVLKPALEKGALESIPLTSSEVREAVAARLETNGKRVTQGGNLKASLGLEDSKDPSVFYPIKPQPKDYPFFAFVKDETVTGAGLGHTSMIHASSDAELQGMIRMVQEKTGYKVYTKADTEAFFKAQKEYDFDRTLHDNYMDASLKSKGVNSQFFPKTDANKIVDSWMTAESRADTVLARETMSTKFAHEFDQLQTLGQQFTDTAGSRYGVTQKAIESTTQNPYNDYRKTALNISRLDEYPTLTNVNRALESGVSNVYQKVRDAWQATNSSIDLEKVNSALQEAGVNHAYKSAAEVLLANHSAPKQYVSNFIRGANSILANTFLRLDPLNGVANAVGAQVLLGHETSNLLKAIRAGNSDVAGELAELSRVAVPGLEGTSILSTPKLIAKANANFFSHLRGEVPELTAMYKGNSWMTNVTDQFKSMLDDLTLAGSENPAQMSTRLDNALAKAKSLSESGAKWTGNNFAEEYNRFVAADVGRQISDLGVKAGVLGKDEQLSYINTFVNRTQGNHLASQRPLIFQGPIGQAVGLFQGFQFNTMQQLFRGVSEGGAKDAAMLLGLQGTMFGMNGLPGFQYINQHIIGTASGNKNHTDAYSSLYGALGKTAGDWLMYGIPSNLLQTNLYSRGDINPRTLTVVPVNPADIVAVSAFSKFAKNTYETLGKMAGGGDIWQSFLQGVEHNGLSRPLAGLAQTLQATSNPNHQVYSTTNQGDISFVNDLISVATLSRLAGGKPLDEALVNDEVARSFVYKAADKERMKAATETFKTSIIGTDGSNPPEAAVNNYMTAFVRNGGRQEDFNKAMLHSMTKVNSSRANEISKALRGPYADRMKILMNGGTQQLDTATSPE